jgi:hypothetical protein
VPAAGVAAAALVLFGFQLPGWGHLLLVAAIGLGWWMDRELGADLTLIGVGIAIVSSTSVEADVEWGSFFRIGTVLALAVTVPFLLDRFLLKRRAIRFPWRSRQKKTRLELAYLFARTRSLGYVLIVHLLFDAIVFLAIVHAHNPGWIPIFIY